MRDEEIDIQQELRSIHATPKRRSIREISLSPRHQDYMDQANQNSFDWKSPVMDRSISPWMNQLRDEAILTSIHGNVYPSITDPERRKLEIEGWDAAI